MIKILVLEDHDQMREALVEALEDEGYHVAVATRGEEAVEKASREPFDLLITDIRMEGMDGLEALRHVRRQQPSIHSMVITGYSTEDDSIRAIRLGAGDYLRKPFKLNEFLKRVNRLVAERRRQLERAEAEQRLKESGVRLAWALAQCTDREAVKAGALTRWLCGEMGQPSPGPVVSAIATSLSLSLGDKLPKGLEPLCLRVDPGMDWQSLNAEHRVVSLAVEASSGAATPAQLEERFPGRFDPFLLRLLGHYPWRDQPVLERLLEAGSSEENRLGALGRTLEEAGDARGARRAYELLIGLPDGRGAAEGWLGLARLAHRTEQLEESHRHLRQAVETARGLGSAVTADTLLQASLTALDWGLPEVGEWLQEALALNDGVANAASHAETSLALVSLGLRDWAKGESSLRCLLEPDNLPRLTGAASWLMPVLLEAKGSTTSEASEAALLHLVREMPTSLEEAMARHLSPAAKLAALDLVEKTNQKSLEAVPRGLLGESDTKVRRRANAVLSALTGAEQPPPLILYSMGSFEVFLGTERVDEDQWKTSKTKYLLAYLISLNGRPVADDFLLEHFWPGPEQKGRRSLNTAISVIRKALKVSGSKGEVDYFIRGSGQVQFNTKLGYWHDFQELEEAAAEGRRLDALGMTGDAIEHYARACRFYRGPYLQDCYMDWAAPIRTRLEQETIAALTRVAGYSLQANQPELALEAGLRLIELSPFDEAGYLLSMRAYVALGRYGQAVILFSKCEKTLAEELSMEPSIEMLRMYQVALMSQSSSTIG